MQTNYRGFTIELRAEDSWSAEIRDAETGKSWSQRLRTPIDEGEDACLKRAQSLVDTYIALNGAR